VVGVGEEVVEGGGEAAFPRGEAGAARVAPQREWRWKEGERDAEAVAVEELDSCLSSQESCFFLRGYAALTEGPHETSLALAGRRASVRA
jgi:hypothetical protein